jgi:hypothetical protein
MEKVTEKTNPLSPEMPMVEILEFGFIAPFMLF